MKLVQKEEHQNQNVTVLMDIMMTELTQYAHHVDINVKLVNLQLSTVLFVNPTESVNPIVIVIPDSMPSMKCQNVKLVTLNVKNVPKKHTQTVPNVPKPEFKVPNQTVHVKTDFMNWPIKLVDHVIINVKHVQEVPIIVLLVGIVE